MMVSLTDNQLTLTVTALEQSSPAYATVLPYLAAGQARGSRMNDVAMPAIGWRACRDAVAWLAYSQEARSIRNHPSMPTNLKGLLSRIERAVAIREMHPCLFGRGALGNHSTCIPTWSNAEFRFPYPGPDLEFALMVPSFHEVQSSFTTWVPVVPSGTYPAHVFADPASHQEIFDALTS